MREGKGRGCYNIRVCDMRVRYTIAIACASVCVYASVELICVVVVAMVVVVVVAVVMMVVWDEKVLR